MILSDSEIIGRTIEDLERANLWREGEWDDIGNQLLISPFHTNSVGTCTYDLHIGEEYLSIRHIEELAKSLSDNGLLKVKPGETVLILTEEYIALPRNLTALIVPRARYIFEGTSINATRVDPTWYGKLIIGLTNHSKNPIRFEKGEEFCAIYFIETGDVSEPLTSDVQLGLGRTDIGKVELPDVTSERIRSPEEVTRKYINGIVDEYGVPWDGVRGIERLNRKALTEWIDDEVAPNIVDEAVDKARSDAFDKLLWAVVLLVVGIIGYLLASALGL